MAYSQAWLEDTTAIRCILVELAIQTSSDNWLHSSNATIYLSSTGYVTVDGSVSYNPILLKAPQITESLAIGGSAGLSFGDLEIANDNGDLDIWLDSTQYLWVNQSIKIYYGDPSWDSADITAIHSNFKLIFDGVIGNIDSKSRETINIVVLDKLQRLNTPVTEFAIGTFGTWGTGVQTNQANILPIVFGEVFNIAPVLLDPSLLQYIVCSGARL